MQAVLPHFRTRGTRTDRQRVVVPEPRADGQSIRSAYSASKAALNSLTANLRMDLAATDPGINVTLVMPGLVSTEFAQNAVHGTPPIGPGAGGAPPQTAEEVAQVIVGAIDHPVAEVFTNPPSPASCAAIRRRRRLRSRDVEGSGGYSLDRAYSEDLRHHPRGHRPHADGAHQCDRAGREGDGAAPRSRRSIPATRSRTAWR